MLDHTLPNSAGNETSEGSKLLDHPAASTGPFTLGSIESHAKPALISAAHVKAVHFRPNTFNVPQAS